MSKDKVFDEFMQKVDEILEEEFGLMHDDLPDYIWYNHYQSGDTPEDSVKAYEDSGYLD